MACPSATLPRPRGNPVPSGLTSMSQPAISAGVAGFPRPNLPAAFACAAHADAASATPTHMIRMQTPLRRDLDIAHFAAWIDAPRLDRVVVVDRARSAHFAQLPIARLHVAGLVD